MKRRVARQRFKATLFGPQNATGSARRGLQELLRGLCLDEIGLGRGVEGSARWSVLEKSAFC